MVIGKDCKSLSQSQNPLDYVLGYTVGNDVSSRYWQSAARSSGQHGYAKPFVVSPLAIPNPSKLKLITHVNGEGRQESGTDSLIFDVPAIIQHLSGASTLRPGTVMMTGTPSGVAAFRKLPAWPQDGDVVEVEIEGIGKIRNRMVIKD